MRRIKASNTLWTKGNKKRSKEEEVWARHDQVMTSLRFKKEVASSRSVGPEHRRQLQPPLGTYCPGGQVSPRCPRLYAAHRDDKCAQQADGGPATHFIASPHSLARRHQQP